MQAPTELSLAEILAALVVGTLVVACVLPCLDFLAWVDRARGRLAVVAAANPRARGGCTRPVGRAS